MNFSHVVFEIFGRESSIGWGCSVPEADLDPFLWFVPHVNEMGGSVGMQLFLELGNTNAFGVKFLDLFNTAGCSRNTNCSQMLLVFDEWDIVCGCKAESHMLMLHEFGSVCDCWADQFKNNISAWIDDHTVVCLVIITGPFQTCESDIISFEFLKVFVQVNSVQLGIVVHEMMELCEISPFVMDHVFNIGEGMFTIWMVSAVDGVETETTE